MKELIEIHWSSGSLDEARKVARFLIQEKIVACAQIIPWIESVYTWNGELETAQESKVVLKTIREHFERVLSVIEENSQYEVPEVTATSLIESNPSYKEWLIDSIKSNKISP